MLRPFQKHMKFKFESLFVLGQKPYLGFLAVLAELLLALAARCVALRDSEGGEGGRHVLSNAGPHRRARLSDAERQEPLASCVPRARHRVDLRDVAARARCLRRDHLPRR